MNLSYARIFECHTADVAEVTVHIDVPQATDLLKEARREAPSQLRKSRNLLIKPLKECRARANLQKRSRVLDRCYMTVPSPSSAQLRGGTTVCC
jgi:hypothetical protein